MDIAIVTGASSSLGLAISRRLIQLGFRVYGLGGDYNNCDLQNVNFRPISCDLANPTAVEAAAKQVLEKEKRVYLLVNNAKYFSKSPFLKMETGEIETILRVNLLCPLVLVRTLADSLKELQGYVIQLGATHAETSRDGPAGAASSGGLKWMGEVLFQDLRRHGVRVCHLSPEPNSVRPIAAQVRRGARTEASIDPEAVAQAVEQMLQSPFGNVITEMILRPLRMEELDQEPVVKLPYPDPQPIPYTVPREYIEAEEQLEEEEWKQAMEKKRNRRRKPAKQESDNTEKSLKESKQAEPTKTPESINKETGEEPAKRRRRSRRKPKPPVVEVGFHKPTQELEKVQQPEKKEIGEEKPAKKVAKKAIKRATTKGAAKTAVKKRVTKNTGNRKAVKKAARKTVAKKAARKAVRKIAKKSSKPADSGKETAQG